MSLSYASVTVPIMSFHYKSFNRHACFIRYLPFLTVSWMIETMVVKSLCVINLS